MYDKKLLFIRENLKWISLVIFILYVYCLDIYWLCYIIKFYDKY